MRRLLELALLAALVVGLPACLFARAATRSMATLVSSPKKVKQERHPVRPDARLAVVWIGHATALIQIDDKVILTDPVFTSTVGQLSKRLVEPGIDPEDLPPVDAVLISHLHYDHLSLGSVVEIQKRIRTMLMPPGGTAYLTDFGFPVYELRTWQAWTRGGLTVTAVPVAHVGGRYGIDSEWMEGAFTGYVVEYHGMKVYFGGDSAYDQALFAETGQRFPKLDLALLPIAPIEPRDIMRHFHMDPREALQAFFDLRAARMVPIHYGTFVNSTDEPGDALQALKAGLAEASKKFRVGMVAPLAIGERRIFLKPGEGPPPEEGKGKAKAKAPKNDEDERETPPAPAPTPSSSSKVPDEDKFE
jgi:L-ascorbate metabolism protein UlaG (beta-lactamase superfamily)